MSFRLPLPGVVTLLACLLAPALAVAAPKVTVTPKSVKPGQAVLVTVTGAKAAPTGKAADRALAFYRSKAGYQAVFAVPLNMTPGEVIVAVADAPEAKLTVTTVSWPATSIIVEDELANPAKAERDRIDVDNQAITGSFDQADGEPQFTGVFKKPAGKLTSTFGEWRTFNDGHRSQHLGIDVLAKEGSKVKAINSGTVVLVTEALLAGNVVVVAHGAGIASSYYHLSEITVKKGDKVAIGDQLGLVGQTGRTTGPHLHLSVRVHGGFVDPTGFFALKVNPVRAIRPAR